MKVAENTTFFDEISSYPSGEKIKHCMQCGTCSASCPTIDKMEHTPRKLFEMIRAGMADEVLSSNTIWYCVSCYSCTVRCPQNIKITDIMYLLKNMSVSKGLYKSGTGACSLSKAFVATVNKYGRTYEPELMTRLLMDSNPLKVIDMMPVGLNLILKGRLPVVPKTVKKMDEINAIISEAKKLGGIR